MKKFFTTFLIVFVLVLLPFTPTISFVSAQGDLGTAKNPIVPCGGENGQKCDYRHLVTLVSNITDFLVFYIAIPLATLSFVIAGLMMVVYSSNQAKVSEAKSILLYAFIGFVVALSAWLIVGTIVNNLIKDSQTEIKGTIQL